MRCGSTLMVQILTSNPDIAGFGETLISYRSIADLEALSTHVYFALRRLRPSRLVLDKALHDDLYTDDVLLAKNCTFPIMAREAIASVRSMVTTIPQWFDKRPNPSSQSILLQAADYYRRRLDTLCHNAEILSRVEKCLYFTYDDVMARSASVFRMLEKSLRLRHPLSECYALGPKTGEYGFGDPSENIKRGYIDRSIVREPIVMPQKLVETLIEHYRAFDERMRRMCSCTATSSPKS
jgi:hypothetical protein